MREEMILIANMTGLHARPAAKLVEVSSKFTSSVELIAGEKTVNAKSILTVLSSGINAGAEVELKVAGEDEDEAFAAVSEYLHNLPD